MRFKKWPHEIETVLDLARNGSLQISPAHVDVILAGKDYLNRSLTALEEMIQSGKEPVLGATAELLVSIRDLAEKRQEEDAVPCGAERAFGRAGQQRRRNRRRNRRAKGTPSRWIPRSSIFWWTWSARW